MNPKVAFLIPAYNSVPLPAWQSHINLLANAGRFCQPFIITASSCYVHETRNRLLDFFLDADEVAKFDYAFWIDSDIVFNWNDCAALVKKLEREKLHVLSGLYYNPLPAGLTPMISKHIAEEDRYIPVALSEPRKDNLISIDGGGLGFVLQTGQCLRKMMGDHGKHFFEFRLSARGTVIGEDNVFFEKARKSGFDAYADIGVRVGHAKTGIF